MSVPPAVKGITGMPVPKTKRAPNFKPKHPEDLKSFLMEYEGHAAACGLTKEEKATMVVKYTSKEMGKFWKKLEGYEEDYDKLKKNILKSFSESQLTEEVTTSQLRKVIRKAGKTDMEDEADLHSYYYKFWTIAADLVKAKKITSEDRDHYFWEGLPTAVRKAIRRRLEAHDQTFKRTDIPGMEKAVEVGRFVLTRDGDKRRKGKKGKKGKREESSDEESESGESDSSDEESSEEESEDSEEEEERKKKKKKSKKKEVRTKKVKFRVLEPKDEVAELTSKLHELDVRDVSYTSTYARLAFVAPAIAEKIPPPARWLAGAASTNTITPVAQAPANVPQTVVPVDRSCLFCKGISCRLNTCGVAAEYVRLGRVMRQPNRFFAHADGTRIERHPRGFKGAVDFKLGIREDPPHRTSVPTQPQNQPAPPTVLSTYVMVGEVEEEEVFASVEEISDEDEEEGAEEEEAFVWGAIAQLEEISEDVGVESFATTRAKEKEAAKKGEEKKKEEARKEEERQKDKPRDFRNTYPQPAYRFESQLTDPQLAPKILDQIFEGEAPKLSIKELLTVSPELCRGVAERTRTRKVPVATEVMAVVPAIALDFSTPLRELEVGMKGGVQEWALLDEGSEIVIVRKDLCEELGLRVNGRMRMTMQTANGGREALRGCAEWMEIEVMGVRTYAHAFVADNAPFRLLLGRPWQKSVRLGKVEKGGGEVDVVITDPVGTERKVVVPTRERIGGGLKSSLVAYGRGCRLEEEQVEIRGGEDSLTEAVLFSSFRYDPVAHCLAYKKVADKVRPVAATMPSEFRMMRRFPEDPLKSLPLMTPFPSAFSPGARLTQERMDMLGLFENEFLWPEERKLIAEVLVKNELGLAWDESEKGRFREDYFSPVKIPVVEHVPWTRKSLPIPPGIREKIISLIKQKVESGVYEPSYSSYRHPWFTVAKKDGSVRIVHNLTPLNAATIRDSQEPPLVHLYAEQCAARAIFSGLDLFVGYDHRTLAEESRDYTTFDTPLGTMRLTVLPQGWTGSVGIFHNDVAFILQHETEKAPNFLDDITLLGPKSRYENSDGTYEVIPENPKIRRFVWEHAVDLNRVLHRLKHAGATISAKKLQLCLPEIVVVGRLCTYEGQEPDVTTVEKVLKWPECRNVTEVRGFLGMAGTVRNWIKGFAEVCDPLTKLTRVTKEEFRWEEEQKLAMEEVKKRVSTCEAIRPIDHSLPFSIILSVDTSVIAVGFVLAQLDKEERRRPARFGSIAWNDRVARYSQAKLELYGLFRALNATKLWIIGAKKLVVEVDAQYIKGMLNKPDIHPNAAMNRWIAAILMFDFELVHVPGAKHKGPDGLSRRRAAEEVGEEVGEGIDEAEEWVDEVLGCAIWVAGSLEGTAGTLVLAAGGSGSDRDVTSGGVEEGDAGLEAYLKDRNEEAGDLDKELAEVRAFLETLKMPTELPEKAKQSFIKRAGRFFASGGKLWKKDHGGRHQQVVTDRPERYRLLIESHDRLGHKGYFATRRTLGDRFWWPTINSDLRWYLSTCHQCQIRSTQKVLIPPTVQHPAALFRKAYIDTMHMPPSHGYKYIVQARCSLTGWPEWRALKKENARTLGAFIFEEVLCRWGGLDEIVTDNGAPFVAALEWLSAKYHIRHIRISAYNSQSNGVVEATHRTIRDALVKACEGDARKWYEHAPYIFWADRVTTRKATRMTPYYAAHGIEPLLPFDITEATFLSPPVTRKLSDIELLAIRARALEKRDDDFKDLEDKVLTARWQADHEFLKRYGNNIKDYDFKPGALVLVLNKRIEPEIGRKCKPRYFGPMVVVKRRRSGAYTLAEVNGAVSKLKFAAFRLIPYRPRSLHQLHVTEFVDKKDLEDEDDVELEEAADAGN